MSKDQAISIKDKEKGRALLKRHTGLSELHFEKLEIYVHLLQKWQRKINLIGPSTVQSIWTRHIFDSAQLATYLPKPYGDMVDLGSGAGFPGMVIALLTGVKMHLIDSDTRKCLFLHEVARETGANVEIHNQRIENIEPLGVGILTARALARLDILLPLAKRHLNEEGVCLFLKGRQGLEELTGAQKLWKMNVTCYQSLSDENGSIIKIEDLSRR